MLAAAALALAAPVIGAPGPALDSLTEKAGVVGAVPPATAPVPSAPAPVPAEREWLVMVFLNGRSDLGPAAKRDLREMEKIGSTDKVAVTAELGLTDDRGESVRMLVVKDAASVSASRPEGYASPAVKVRSADMGSWKHFVDFARWSYKKYPAKKVMAVLWNHGSGRLDLGGADNSGAELGIAYDELTRNFIRNKQLGMALGEIEKAIGKKISVYASDACLMQMAGVAYEIKDGAEFIVGSEESIPPAGFPYNRILEALTAEPGMNGEKLSALLVDKFHDYYNDTPCTEYSDGARCGATLSALRSSALPEFARRLNDWVSAAAIPANRAALLEAENKALSFENGYNGRDTSYNARSKDLCDFVDLAGRGSDPDSPARVKGEALKAFVAGRLMVSSRPVAKDEDYKRATGLAVYFPKLIYDASYDENLFSRDSLWDDFLKWKLDPAYRIGR